MKFVEFTGDETEKEFLEKCLQQWEIAVNSDVSDLRKIMKLGVVFSEMRHRIDEIE